jgi:fumarate reductase flavoprotein subunit
MGSDPNFDVVAVGGGFAGLVSAARAAQLGLKAAVLEQQVEARYACNSRYTTGVFSIASQATQAPAAELAAAIMAESDGTAKREVVDAIAATASRAAEWLTEEGMRFVAITNAGGRKLMLGPPRRYKEGLDWEGRGGDFLLRKLEENLVARGGALLRGTKALALVMEGGRCVGVRTAGGTIGAKAVVLADGGFHANPELVGRYLSPRPERVLVRGAPSARGDGLRMAAEAGAALGGFGSFYGHLHHLDAMTNDRLWPYPHFDSVAEAGVLVGADGRRFTDEGEGGVYMANAVARLDDPAATAGLTQTMGGVEINAHAQALRADGAPIPGLYVAGAPVARVEGGPRAGYTGGLAKAFTLGLIAADHIAEEHRRA